MKTFSRLIRPQPRATLVINNKLKYNKLLKMYFLLNYLERLILLKSKKLFIYAQIMTSPYNLNIILKNIFCIFEPEVLKLNSPTSIRLFVLEIQPQEGTF